MAIGATPGVPASEAELAAAEARLVGLDYGYEVCASRSVFLPNHLEFDFTAATTDMSRMFARSPSIHNWFAELACDHEAPVSVLDLEEKGRMAIH